MRWLLAIFLFASISTMAQKDTLVVQVPDSLLKYLPDTGKITFKKFGKYMSQAVGLRDFFPEEKPRVAFIRSALIPGWGQYTNKDYWKLPLVYGAAFSGYYFGIFQNQQKFLAYREVLEKIVALTNGNVKLDGETFQTDGVLLYLDPNANAFDIRRSRAYVLGSDGYYTFIPINDTNGRKVSPNQQFELLKDENIKATDVFGPFARERIESGTNSFRRFRDLSRIGFAAGWILLAVEANVAGHLKTFDSSEDISFNLTPMVFPGNAVGINLNITF